MMMKKTYLFTLIMALLFSYHESKAQFLQDNSGIVYKPLSSYSEVGGTPFLNTNWADGTVKLKNGSTYKNVSLKFNQYDQVLLFKAPSGAELKFVQPVEEFTIANGNEIFHFKNFFNGPNSKEGNSFFRVLYNGGIAIYKKLGKDIAESTEYGSSKVDKKFVDVNAYYVNKISGELTIIKPDKKNIVSLFPKEKQDRINEYLTKNKVNFKVDQDLINLFAYGNSL